MRVYARQTPCPAATLRISSRQKNLRNLKKNIRVDQRPCARAAFSSSLWKAAMSACAGL